MSKILKHRENIYNFITEKSCFSNIIEKEFLKEIIDNDLCLYPIALLSIFSIQVKKNKTKSYHTLHMASAIVLMIMKISINENIKYYQKTSQNHLIVWWSSLYLSMKKQKLGNGS